MPPKKRTVPAATALTAVKRKKVSEATPKQDMNSTNSPLLRLPAELREMIWKYAYSNMMVAVHAESRLDELDEPENELIFHVYKKTLTGLSMKDAQDARSRPPNLVCRQFWAETSRVFLCSCDLRISDPAAMSASVSTKQNIVQCARSLIIVYDAYELCDFPRDWVNVLSCYTIGRFKNLEGAELHLWIDFFDLLGVTTDFMNHDSWKKAKLPNIVRAFQQHRLKHSLFKISFKNGVNFDVDEDVWLAEFNEAVRKELLNHHPRRVSRRGRGENDGY